MSAVFNGKYGLYCKDCLSRKEHAGIASYSREKDREAHQADLVQPWNADGSPSKDYARLYPEMVDEMYSKEEKEQL